MAEAPVIQQGGFALARPQSETSDSARYRTFPRKTAPTLAAAGGAIALIGSLGAWIRATQITSSTQGPQSVGTLWGFEEPSRRARRRTSRSADMATAARQQPNFESFNAGFGWGAWLLLLATVLTFLSLLVGGLREL